MNKKELKNKGGITLVALVITIIILIILATITINAVFGDNGLIKQAEYARDLSVNSTEAEYEGMNRLYDEYMNMIEDGEKEITIRDLKAGDYVEYDSGTNGIILCRVLYPLDSEYGLQIISDKIVKDVTLGGSTFEEGRESYNKAIETLNNEAEAYINTTFATDARCVGSVPTVEDGVFINKDKKTETTVTLPPPLLEGEDSSTWWTNYTRPSGWTNDDTGCYDTDTNYTTDETALKDARIWIADDIYWLASHHANIGPGSCYFDVRKVHTDGVLGGDDLCNVVKDGRTQSAENTYGFRPCFLLNNNLKITGGDGSENAPYTLGI